MLYDFSSVLKFNGNPHWLQLTQDVVIKRNRQISQHSKPYYSSKCHQLFFPQHLSVYRCAPTHTAEWREGGQDVPAHDPPQHNGPHHVWVSAPGAHLLLYDQLWWGGHTHRLSRCTGWSGHCIWAVPGGRWVTETSVVLDFLLLL